MQLHQYLTEDVQVLACTGCGCGGQCASVIALKTVPKSGTQRRV